MAKEPRYTLSGPRLGQWKVIDNVTGNPVGGPYESDTAAWKVADACNEAHAKMAAEHKSIMAQIKELVPLPKISH